MQNSEVTACNSNNAILSNITTKLQDLLATVMAGIEDQRTKQRAAFLREVAKLMENLKAQFKQENEKPATSFTERIEAAHKKLREKFNNKLQEEIQGIPDRVDILKKYIEDDTDKLTKSVNFK